MKKTKFQRITALMLALVFLLTGGVISAAAASSDDDRITAEELASMLNAISYNDYISDYSDVKKAENAVEIDATKNFASSVAAYASVEDIPDGTDKKGVVYIGEFDGEQALYTPSNGTVTWNLTQMVKDNPTLAAQLAENRKYSMIIEYYPVENKSAAIERVFRINGEIPFSEAGGLSISKVWKNVYPDADGKSMPSAWTVDSVNSVGGTRFFTIDIDNNELRSSLVQAPKWTEYYFKDANGFRQDSFEFVVGPDDDGNDVTISLESVNEPMAIRKIKLVPHETAQSYASYLESLGELKNDEGQDSIKIEAEYYSAASSQTIYPISDSTSAITSPSATDRILLNTVGGDKWQSSGQWIEYKFKVADSGMYTIATRFKQSVLDGMYTSRAMYIYSDDGSYNGLPFEEAGRLQFGYSSEWQSGFLTDGENTSFNIYFKEGVEYTVRFEVTLGNMGDIVGRVQSSLEAINADYLNILKLTGSNPDENRDYGFSRVMPDTMRDLIIQGNELAAVSEALTSAASVKSSMAATLDKVSRLLIQMGKDNDEVAKNLEQLKTYIGSLGTWLSDAKTQPLVLDYLVVQPASDTTLPEASAGFFEALGYEISSFFQSFFRNYNRTGAMTEVKEDESVEVWLAYGRDQTQVIRGLVNNDFTPSTGVAIDLKLVAGGTLLPSILSGMGPDAYIGLGQNEVINYAIRGALLKIGERELVDKKITYKDVEGCAGFAEAVKDFDESAMTTLGTEDAEGNYYYYGLPETQNFTMMFVRDDIFADLGLDIPETWDDVKEAIPVLQSNNMQIGMIKDENIFLYQMGGDLFADDGMRINLDSNVALDAFNTMTEMFTMYSFPYKYDFANRFRTGEMPIGFASYTATYNQLKVFATEIEGLWSFYPLPGYYDEATDSINKATVSTITAISLIKGCSDIEGAWKFISWHADDQCQIDYANEMVALLGPSAKHATANISALESLPWTEAELEQLGKQMEHLAAIPNYPGRYIVERYTQFAFLDAFNDNADPVVEMQSYIKTINTEITRKRAEFGLETLEEGQTLAQKRMAEAETLMNEFKETSAYSSDYDALYDNIMTLIKDYVTEDYASLDALAADLEALGQEKLTEAARKLKQASDALESYEAYK